MFSQLSSFANKLSLDNLQEDDKDATAPEPEPARGRAEEGGGVSSLLDGLSSAVSRSSRPPPAPKPAPDTIDATNLAIISSLENKVAQLTGELGEKAAALQQATRETSSLREELKTERAGSRELATRYKALCESSSVDAKRVGVLTDRVKALQDQLAAETAACEDLKKQLSVISIPVAEETPKKVVKKVKKKKAAATPASPMGEADSVPASPAVSEQVSPIRSPAPEQSASDELLDDMKRSMQQMKQKYEEEIDQLTAQIRGLDNASQSAEDDYNAKMSECSAQMATSGATILSLEQTIADLKEQSKTETEQLMAKIQQLQQDAQEAEEAAESRYQAVMERNETLQDESSLLCQRLAKSESDGGTKDGEYTKLIAEKDAKINDLSTKLSNLTEKAKDYVKKYSEAKMQIANFDEVKNKLTSELAEATQSKDSEVVKMRLKLESQDSVCESQKDTIRDLTEKVAETQRELQRCKDSLQDGRNMIDVLQRDVKEVEGVAEELREQKAAADARAVQMAAEHEEALDRLRKDRGDEIERLQTTIQDLKGNSQGHVQEMEELRKEKAIGDAALKSLDEYKKKAQAALKKSSETSAALNAEISKLKQALDSANSENESLTSDLDKERQKCEESEALVIRLRDEIKRMQEAELKYEESLSAALQAVETSKAHHENEANPDRVPDTGTNREHDFDEKSDVEQEQSDRPADDDELATEFAASVPTRPEDEIATQRVSSPGQHRINDENSRGEDTTSKSATAPLRRSVSGTSLQATLASKNGSSMEISEGLLLPLQIPDKLLYIGEITQQLEKMRGDLVNRNMEIDVLNKEVENERTEKKLLKDKLEDCLAFLERSKKLQNGNESAVNMEYLKNCVLHYMLSDSVNDRLRLYPVIATILKFTSAEKSRLQNCPLHVDEIAASIEIADKTWQNLSGTFSGLWGSYSSTPSSTNAPESSST